MDVALKQEKWFFPLSTPFWKWVFLLTQTERLFIFKQFLLLVWLGEIQFYMREAHFFSFMTLLLMENPRMNAKQSKRMMSFDEGDIFMLPVLRKKSTFRSVLDHFYDGLEN